ncbi:hypothetical protein [Motilibacter aurantiacus]|uniref:hypothetical protein n=1 Tax=Motilibacter aurantiacus TaxID=2714955 RepID=UPI00140E66AC|nr:hypothetical protein [Motilibacter aurantiacus]NHC47135.1 hypothetical protein [Motilibacter aurantiacus]
MRTDPVTLLTTTHMRRFCSVECIAQGQQVWTEIIYSSTREDYGHGGDAAIQRAVKKYLDAHPASS